MYQIIAPRLFQNKICRLPGIGALVVVTRSAETDFINTRIKGPVETIEFIKEAEGEKLFNEFSAISELLKKHLDENGSYFLNGIGTFSKTQNGELLFTAIQPDPAFTPDIKLERVIRQNKVHSMVVGDQYTTNVEMTEYFNEPSPSKDNWWVWAIVLGALGVGALLWYFYQNGLKPFGNTTHW